MVLSKSLFLPVTEGQNPKKLQLREVTLFAFKKAEINVFWKKNSNGAFPRDLRSEKKMPLNKFSILSQLYADVLMIKLRWK